MVNKKGLFFTIDAILAVTILLGTLIALTSFYVNYQPRANLDYMASDLINVLAELEVGEINNSYVNELIADENITKLNNTLLVQAGEFWAEDETSIAYDFIKNITDGIVPNNYGYSFIVGGNSIYARNISDKGVLSVFRRVVSGIEKSKPTEGTVAQTYLLSIQKKETESYTYFGGFVGQGNLTRYIDDIPHDADISQIILELDANSDFELYINELQCLGNFNPVSLNMSADKWDITACKNDILNGTRNNFTIKFLEGISDAYLGGGFIKLLYSTSEMTENKGSGTEKYYFPGINGHINFYSAFNVPGTLTGWKLNVSFYNNLTTYLVIANETIFNTSGSNETQNIYAERTGLFIPSDTIPIRLGVLNRSSQIINMSGDPSDSILVTDISGSMDECAEYSDPLTCDYWCLFGGSKSCQVASEAQCSSNVCGGFCFIPVGHSLDCDSSKLDIAKEADKLFVDILLNYSGTRIGLDSYENDMVSSLALSTDHVTLDNRIDSYTAGGGTCICCGIYGAVDLLPGTNEEYIIVMSDGEANYKCDGPGDTNGEYDVANAPQSAIDAGQYACNNSIKVYAVGFGYDSDEDTLKQVACNSSMYYNATNVTQLIDVYSDIGGQIGSSVNYTAQILNVTGSVGTSILYPNSFIEFSYNPIVPSPTYGEITINLGTDVFKNCTPSIYIYDDITVTDVKITSYSSEHWTDLVIVNNQVVFNLSKYDKPYFNLGDPFVIQIPPDIMVSGAYNNISLKTGDDPYNNTGCSMNNSILVFRGTVKANVAFTDVLPDAEGCKWYVEFDDGGSGNLTVPSEYSGSNSCNFTASEVRYNINDTIDVAAYKLLSQLDFDDNNMSNVNFDELDMTIGSFLVPEVPSMWGPTVVEVRLW